MEKNKNKKTGQFKPKKKFIGFISGLKSGHRLNYDTATIDGSKISGMLEDNKFEIKIYKDGTIDMMEVDNKVDSDTISRIIDQLCDMDVIGYTGKFVLGLEFDSIQEVNKINKNKSIVSYLEVDHIKPIDTLFSLINDEKKTPVPEVSKKALSLIDFIMDEVDNNDNEESKQPEDKESKSNSFIGGMFSKMNDGIVDNIKDRIEKTVSEIKKAEFDKASAENRLVKNKEDLRVLSTRLDSMSPNCNPNGWVFFVSEEIRSDIEVDDNTKEIIQKISPILRLNPDKVIDFISEKYYTIKIVDKTDLSVENREIDVPKEIIQSILDIDLVGKISRISKYEFRYIGDLNWHQIVGKMIKLGFSQDPEFDKLSGSNSYKENKINVEMSSKIDKFENFDPDPLLNRLTEIESENSVEGKNADSISPKDLIFAIYGTTNKNGHRETFLCVSPKQKFEDHDHEQRDEVGRPKVPVKSFLKTVGNIGIDIPGMNCIQEGVYILGELGKESHNYSDIVKIAIDFGLKPNKVFQNYVSENAKWDNDWEFFAMYTLYEILDDIKYDYSNDDHIYFLLRADGFEEDSWDIDRKFNIYVSNDRDNFDTSDPNWDHISGIITSIGIVPESKYGFSSECSISFGRDEQPDNIKNMKWSDLMNKISDDLIKNGWVCLD